MNLKRRIFYIIYILSYLSVPLGLLMRFLGESIYFKYLRQSYNLFSRFYDNFTLNLPNYDLICKLITSIAYPSKADRALDVACGTGLVSLPIAEKAYELIGVDISIGQLRQLKTKAYLRNLKIYLVLGDARAIPFRDETFSIVTCSGALSEITDKEKVVREVFRVLKYGGRAVIMTMDRESIPLLHSWAYDMERLRHDLNSYRLRNIKVVRIEPFYIVARAEKR